MKSVSVLVILVLGTFIKSSVDALQVKCKGVSMDVPEQIMFEVMECMTAQNISKFTDLNINNAGCLVKCVMEKRGLVDVEGRPHKENIMKAIDDHLPPSLVEPWKAAMEKCLDNEGMKIKSTDAKGCSSYLPLASCVHRAFRSIC